MLPDLVKFDKDNGNENWVAAVFMIILSIQTILKNIVRDILDNLLTLAAACIIKVKENKLARML